MSTGAPRRRNTPSGIYRSWLSPAMRHTGQTDDQKDHWRAIASCKVQYREPEWNASYWPRPAAKHHRDEWRLTSCVLLGEGLRQPGKGQGQGSQNLWASQGLCPLAPGWSVVARFGRMLCFLSSSGHFPCHPEEQPEAPTFPFLQPSNGLESQSTEYKRTKLNIPSYKHGLKCAGWLNTQGSWDAFFVYFFLLRIF